MGKAHKIPTKGGRPLKPVSEKEIKQIEFLAQAGATDRQITAMTGISANMLSRRFRSVLKRGREAGPGSILGAQMRLALGMAGRPAEYMRDKTGELIFAKDGRPILLKAEVKASPPNTTMLIWLGKQKLGQRDDPDPESFDPPAPPQVNFSLRLPEGKEIDLDPKKLADRLQEFYKK